MSLAPCCCQSLQYMQPVRTGLYHQPGGVPENDGSACLSRFHYHKLHPDIRFGSYKYLPMVVPHLRARLPPPHTHTPSTSTSTSTTHQLPCSILLIFIGTDKQ